MHHFSEKMRFDRASFTNAEKRRGHAADSGDTGAGGTPLLTLDWALEFRNS